MNSQQNEFKPKLDVYQMVTNRIIDLLNAGTVPWQKPWADKGMPRNLVSKRPYRGVNFMLLNALDFEHNLWLTWKQTKTINASVKKGEKGQFVIFTKIIEKEVERSGKKEIEKRSMLRYYKVFNVGQLKDVPKAFFAEVSNDNAEIADCKTIVEHMPNPPQIVHKKEEAYYSPREDYINMPKLKSFNSSDGYYGVLFHELIHSTGHKDRCNRKEIADNPEYGSVPYAQEELVGEIGGCFLKSHAGLSVTDLSNNASYIEFWLSKLKNDKRLIVTAASRAQQAVEYILQTNAVAEHEEEKELAETTEMA